MCQPGQLSIFEHRYPQPIGSYVATELGNSAVAVMFKNQSSSTCTLSGYPKVAGLDRAGAAVTEATPTLSGYTGGLPIGDTRLPVVVLHPGQEASSQVEGVDNPVAPATSCPTLSGLAITVPGRAPSPVRVPAAPGDCRGLTVHPFVAGRFLGNDLG